MISRKVLLLTAVPAALLYALMWWAVAGRWSWVATMDTWALQHFHSFGATRPGWVTFWKLVSDIFGPAALRVVALVGIVAALLRRNVRVAAFLAVTVTAAGLVTAAAKALADRPRPGTALTHAASSSFPSGHALAIMVGVLAILTVLWPRLSPSLRIPLVAVGVSLVFLVGLARVALNVHHPSDVIAGWALGLLYYVLCVAVVSPRLRRPSAV